MCLSTGDHAPMAGLVELHQPHITQSNAHGNDVAPMIHSPPTMKAESNGAKITGGRSWGRGRNTNGGVITPMSNRTHLDWLAPQIVPLA